MIVAAAAAMTAGAFADVCDPVPVTTVDGECLVYDLSFKFKTLGPKRITCDDLPVYYLKDASRTLKGYVWFCESQCWDTDSEPYIVLWDTKAKAAVIPLFYTVEGGYKNMLASTIAFDFLGRYDKKANKVAAFWTVEADDATIYAAGVKGKTIIDKEDHTALLKSISGNAVGMFNLSTIEEAVECDDPNEFTAKIATLCECWLNWCDDGDDAEAVPATGTWSLKYNKGVSKGNKSMLQLVPAYAQEQE